MLRRTNNTLAERKTVPEVGWSSPEINFRIVDLPIPLGPTTVTDVYTEFSQRIKIIERNNYIAQVTKETNHVALTLLLVKNF